MTSTSLATKPFKPTRRSLPPSAHAELIFGYARPLHAAVLANVWQTHTGFSMRWLFQNDPSRNKASRLRLGSHVLTKLARAHSKLHSRCAV